MLDCLTLTCGDCRGTLGHTQDLIQLSLIRHAMCGVNWPISIKSDMVTRLATMADALLVRSRPFVDGGVLEHPAKSYAWAAHGLMRPLSSGTWTRDIFGGWVCYVEQAHYGHDARKGTWLYASGVTSLPSMIWGASEGKALVSWCNNHGTEHDSRPRISKREASRTPQEFRDVLISIARSVKLG